MSIFNIYFMRGWGGTPTDGCVFRIYKMRGGGTPLKGLIVMSYKKETTIFKVVVSNII